MLTRNRQGWRLRTVLSRLAVAGLFVAAGFADFLHPDPALAQAGVPTPPQPPPPQRPRPPDPAGGASAVVSEPEDATVGPTPAGSADAAAAPPEQLSASPALERLSAQRNSLNQVLCKDRRHQLLLQRGQAALTGGDIAAAVEHLQALSEARFDAFYWPEESAIPRGARASVEELIRSLPPEQRQMCERLQGDLARALLAESKTGGGTPSLIDLLQRFSHTTAAREAMSQELLRAFDAGHIDLALQYARRLAADEQHWTLLPASHRALAQRLLEERPPEQNNSASPSLGPPALRPRWSYSFTDGLEDLLRHDNATPARPATSPPPGEADASGRVVEAILDSASQWYSERQDRRLPATTANQATVLGELLIVRDFAGLRAMNVHDGQPHWHYRTRGALAEIAAEHVRTGSPAPFNFQVHFSGEGPSGQLTSDGQRVFFLEELAGDESEAATAGEPEQAAKLNRLVALPLHPASVDVEPVWSHPGGGDEPLAGHRFLGPPLALDGRLFVLTECAARLECVALDSGDGRILWRQPIALAPSPIAADAARLRIACSPVFCASTLVCPTEVGVLVGVDPLTGSLRWVYDQLDDDQRHSAGRWSSSTQRNLGSSELPSRTLVHDGRVIHLPCRSASVHCVDAATGTPVWIAPREGALGLSAADDRNILLIGPRQVSSLSPVEGTLQWTTPCPEPAGHGVIAGSAYLLPLAEGRCLALSLEDGEPQGARFGRLMHQLAFPEDEPAETADGGIQLVAYRPASQPSQIERRPPAAGGNLTAAGELIVVTRPTEISVYPMSGALLSDLTAGSGHERLSEEQQLEAAMLHLLLEDRVTARSQLQALVSAVRSPAVGRRATRLLREVLFAELETADSPNAILDQLEQLPADEAEALRLLVHRIDAAILQGDVSALVASLEGLQSYPPEMRIRRDGHGDFEVNAWCDVADRLAQLHADAAQPPPAELVRYVSSIVDRALRSNDRAYQRGVVRLCDGWPQAAVLRNALAAADITSGRLQAAELLLLKNTLAADPDAAARAHSLLVELYATAGFQREAAAHLLRLAGEFAAADVGDAQRGLDFAEAFPDAAVRQAADRQQAPSGRLEYVRISEHVCDETCGDAVECACVRALNHHERIRRKFVTGDDSSVTVIDRGILSADRSQSTLALIDRDSGRLHGELEVPVAYWHLAGAGEGFCGQLLPVSGRSAHGLSLLEKRCLWSSDDAKERLNDKVKIGPIGHDYCVLHSSSRLAVVDPVTGEPLWFRDDLPPEVGLQSNEATGIIGDGETLTIFDEDQLSYTVLRMRSGRLVRRGRLDLPPEDSRRHRRAFGDRLVHVVSDGKGDRLRVWRAGSDEILCDLPLHERLFARVPESQCYAAISRDSELVIIDITSGDIELRAPLSAVQLADVSELHVAAGPEGYLVNLVGCEPENAGDAVAAIDEVELPALRVRGLLLQVSQDGTIQWERQVLDAAALTSLQSRVPLLVLISRVRVHDQRQPATLRVEVLDTRSGETLAVRADLLRTRLVQVEEEHPSGGLRLIGLDSQIVLEFAASPPPMRIHAELGPSPEVELR